jgi:hypothetical protein
VDKLTRYSAHFHVSVYFACLDLDRPDRFYWVALRDLIGRVPEWRGKARVVSIATADTFEVPFTLPFLDAYMQFSDHSLARYFCPACFAGRSFRFEYRDGLAELICSGCLAAVSRTPPAPSERRHAELLIATMEAINDAEEGRGKRHSLGSKKRSAFFGLPLRTPGGLKSTCSVLSALSVELPYQ